VKLFSNPILTLTLVITLSQAGAALAGVEPVPSLCNGEHNGMIDGDEQCETGVCCDSENCTLLDPLTVCRPSAGPCDVDDTCGERSFAVEADCLTDFSADAGLECENESACFIGGNCDGEGACTGGTALVCDDEEVCTDDSCDALIGCVYTPNTAECDDGLFCTVDDVCSGGTCSGSPNPCADENPCTTGACNEMEDSCDQLNNTESCDDGIFCNGPDACSEGECTVHDGDPCDGPDGDDNCAETCDEKAGACTGDDEDETSCDDGNPCTDGPEVCSEGKCVSGEPIEGCTTTTTMTTTTTELPETTTTLIVTTTTLVDDGCGLCGDITCDGKLTARDAYLVLRAAVGLASKCTLEICDFTGDCETTSTDALAVLRAAVGLPSTPSCPDEESCMAEVRDASCRFAAGA
jgi:hypothetical protein